MSAAPSSHQTLAEVLPFHPSQAQYEHVARLLCRFGHVPGVKLRDLDFRLLCFLAGQQPGACHHQYTLAEEMDRALGDDGRAAPDAVHRAINRLRESKLIVSDAAWEGTRTLPRRRVAITRTCVYWLTHELVALLGAEERDRAERTAEARASAAAVAPIAEPPADLSWAEPEIQKIARAFDGLGLRRPVGAREVQALRNRLREGCTMEALWLAVAGAKARTSRADGSVWAKDPFAVVFANREAVGKTAQDGLALRAASADGTGRKPAASLAVATAAAARPESASPMTARMRSPTRSQEIVDRDPDLKTSTRDPAERSEARSGLRPLDDARDERGKSHAAPAAPASEPRLRTAVPIAEPPNADDGAPRASREPLPFASERHEGKGEHEPSHPRGDGHGRGAGSGSGWTEGENPRLVLSASQMRLDVEAIFAPQGRHGERAPRGWRR